MKPERGGWTFHPLPSIAPDDSDECDGGEGGAEASRIRSAASLAKVVSDFDADGFVAVASVFTPHFAAKLREECTALFRGVLGYLFSTDQVDFEASCIRSQEGNQSDKREPYQYPLKVGLKNGYREIVMRSPGRYEMALLLEELPENFDRAIGGHERGAAAGSGYPSDYDGKWLLSTDMLNRAELRQADTRGRSAGISQQVRENGRVAGTFAEQAEVSCLRQLLEWVRICSDGNSHSQNSKKHLGDNRKQKQQYPIDQKSMEQFMELVGAILPSSEDNDRRCLDNTNQIKNKDDNKSINNKDENRNINNNNQNDELNNDSYYLCNLSLLMATPGCPTQSWHADGGHISLTAHERCHVFNIFIPLVDIPNAMGPTELRPGTHVHTRNLAPMMLAAKARKTLRPSVVPEMRMGDALLFDYRILHRGRANTSDKEDVVAATVQNDGGTSKNNQQKGDTESKARNPIKCGRDRPVLVLTFARRWFVDVCNFPKRSIFAS